MSNPLHFLLPFLCITMTATAAAQAFASQVLVAVGDEQVTANDLESALKSSPVATQFNTMDADQQAALRGEMLKRLVSSRLLRLEAERLGLDQAPDFLRELEDYRIGRLYRAYMDRLRSALQIPDAEQLELRQRFAQDPDALAAARSSYISDLYRQQRLALMQTLKARYHLRLDDERIDADAPDDTLLLKADGIQIRVSDLRGPGETRSPEQLEDDLLNRAEVLLVAKAARDEGMNIDAEIGAFRAERLPALLLERVEEQWIPDRAAMRAYFEAHPEIGLIPERRHIGQLVVESQAQARALRRRILDGESLFRLAGTESIDPEGRARNGDMGWLRKGSGMPEIEKAIAHLPDKQVSEVIRTPRGYHLVMILERKPGRQLPFEAIEDRVHQRMVEERLPGYLQGLQERYQVAWRLLDAGDATAAEDPP
jgi:parvulin-like peptidyl-prolyl isomerase